MLIIGLVGLVLWIFFKPVIFAGIQRIIDGPNWHKKKKNRDWEKWI